MSTSNNGTGGGGGAGGGSFIPSGVWIMPITVGGGGGGAGGGILTGDLTGASTPVAEVKKKDGCFCKKCKEHYPYAEPNQKDGTLICYACRMRW